MLTVTMWTAGWCQPCKETQRIMERLAQSMGFRLDLRDVVFYTENAAAAGIRTVPTIQVGNRMLVGRMSETELRRVLEEEFAKCGSASSGS